MNPYHFEFHFASIHVKTGKELTEHRRFSTEMKSHAGFSSFRFSCERTLISLRLEREETLKYRCVCRLLCGKI